MNDANNATPKRFMFVCEFCADNNPEMCGFFDADDLRVAPNGKWLCASCFDEDDSCLNHYYCWNDMPSPTFESLSTPNAPVEREAIARALMEQFHNPDESWFVPEDEYEASKFLVKCADAILAVRLDEATIRKDGWQPMDTVPKDRPFLKLTEAQCEFLSVLAKHTATVGRRDLPLADRQEDKVRQSCRRLGLVKFGKWEGDRVMGWKITPAGRRALEQSQSQEGK